MNGGQLSQLHSAHNETITWLINYNTCGMQTRKLNVYLSINVFVLVPRKVQMVMCQQSRHLPVLLSQAAPAPPVFHPVCMCTV